MKISFELVTALQYEFKVAQRQSALFKSGQKYATMKKEHAQECCRLEQQTKALWEGLHRLHQEQLYVHQQRFGSTNDMQVEYERRIRTLQTENTRPYEQSIKAEMQRDVAYGKVTKMYKKKYQLAIELEEEKGKNQKLVAQSNKDSENSPLPSSVRPIRRKEIPNSQETTSRRPGGQSGHPGHSGKKQTLSQTASL